jgi:hypothetical protein
VAGMGALLPPTLSAMKRCPDTLPSRWYYNPAVEQLAGRVQVKLQCLMRQQL